VVVRGLVPFDDLLVYNEDATDVRGVVMRHDFSVFDGDMIISKANITLSGCSSGRVCLTPQILTRVTSAGVASPHNAQTVMKQKLASIDSGNTEPIWTRT